MSFKYSYKKKSIYTRKRRRANENVRIKDNLNRSLRRLIKGQNVPSILSLVQCDKDSFRKHLESQFYGEINWDNYGSVWHLDHFKPCAEFDLTCPENRKACYHFSNLKPLLKQDNLKKSYKYEPSISQNQGFVAGRESNDSMVN